MLSERQLKFLPRLALVGVLLNVTFTGVAKADDWGCEVLLCLSNPKGPTAVAQCVAPIKKLWRELAKGHAFPTCFMGGGTNGNGTGAVHQFASASFCPDGYLLPPQDEFDRPHCALSGAVTVIISGQPTQRVWWGGEDSFTEPLNGSADSTQRGSASN